MGLTVEHHGSSRASDEALDIMRRLWDYKSGDPAFPFETERYSGTVVKRPVPAPYRKHHPHVIVTARRQAALERAAANGWPVFLGTGQRGDDALLAQQLTAYRTALVAAGHAQATIDECMRWTCYDVMNVSVAETDEQAQENAARARAERNAFRDIFLDRNSRLADAIPVAAELGSREAGAPRPSGGGGNAPEALIGSPDTVARRIQHLSDWGVNHLLLRFMGEWAGDTKPIAEQSMRLFEKEVAPRFKGTPIAHDPLAIDLSLPAVHA
jgi:alkanesulfonate monooxygenase SsuD/methylene tetrahydromethanopterin reductase-like flavin-dependent oxidoreductase (luciferase family)